MPRRKKPIKISRLITQHLSPEVFAVKTSELAMLIAEHEMNLTHVASAVGAQPRAVRRWVKVALNRGVDVLELARARLREQGVDPEGLASEKVRTGMEDARTRPVSDRSDTPRRGPGRPRKHPLTGPASRKILPCNSAN